MKTLPSLGRQGFLVPVLGACLLSLLFGREDAASPLYEGHAEEDSLAVTSDSIRYHLPPSLIEASRWSEEEIGSLLPLRVIGPEKLRHSLDFGIGDLLGQSSGVVLRKSGGPGSSELVSIRGSTSQQVLVLLNGKRLNTAQGGGVDISQFDPGQVTRVEIYREGNSPRWAGASIGGVLNVVTSREAGRNLAVRTTAGSYGARSVSASAGGGKETQGGAWAAFRQSDNDFVFEDPRRGGEQRRVNARVESLLLSSFLETGLGEGQELSVFISSSRDRRGAPGPIEFPTPQAALEDERLYLQGSLSGSLGATDLTLASGLHHQNRHYENPDPVFWADDRHRNTGLSFSLEATRELSRSLSLQAGGSIDRDRLSSTTDGERERSSLAAYVSTELGLSGRERETEPWLTVSPGARLEKVEAYGAEILPSIASKLALRGGIFVLRGSLAGKYRPPSFDELFWPLSSGAEGNPDLLPERSTSAEVSGTFYLFERSARLSGTGFTRWLHDLIEWTPGAKGVWRPHNVGRARERGVELEGSLSGKPAAFLPPLVLEVSHSLLSATDEGEEPTTRGKQLVRRPEHTSTVSLETFHGERFSMGLAWTRTGRRYLTAANTKWLEPYSVLDIHTRLALLRGTSLLFSMKNLGGRSYYDIEDFPVPGRTFMLALDFALGN
jgi:outer membrane cobalamin receptor